MNKMETNITPTTTTTNALQMEKMEVDASINDNNNMVQASKVQHGYTDHTINIQHCIS